jgi:membrane-bound serine protease (ClpP class)
MTKKILLAVVLLFSAHPSFAADPLPAADPVYVVRIDSAITPASAKRISDAVDTAVENSAACLVIELDTPGGLVDSTRRIVKKMMAAPVAVIVYVSPGGARAASAGTFITLAADVAAMAPATNIGAAHPVALGQKMEKDGVMAQKIENDLAAFMKSIAHQKGRNEEWAEKAVRESVSISDNEAVKNRVVDVVSPDLHSLLNAIDGRRIKKNEKEIVLKTKGSSIRYLEAGIRDKILETISNPNLAYILMMLAMLGIYLELSHPGLILPGVIGVVSLILALYAMQTLPVNYAGLLLIFFAVVFFMVEIWVTSYGLLSLAGIVCLGLGSMMLFPSPEPALQLSLKVVVPTVAGVSGLFILVSFLAAKAQFAPIRTGMSGMVGEEGHAATDIDKSGQVSIRGEFWRAVSSKGPIKKDEEIRVVGTKQMRLLVKKIPDRG